MGAPADPEASPPQDVARPPDLRVLPDHRVGGPALRHEPRLVQRAQRDDVAAPRRRPLRLLAHDDRRGLPVAVRVRGARRALGRPRLRRPHDAAGAAQRRRPRARAAPLGPVGLGTAVRGGPRALGRRRQQGRPLHGPRRRVRAGDAWERLRGRHRAGLRRRLLQGHLRGVGDYYYRHPQYDRVRVQLRHRPVDPVHGLAELLHLGWAHLARVHLVVPADDVLREETARDVGGEVLAVRYGGS